MSLSEKVCVSIIIPLFNKEQTINATLKSVLAQSFSDFEVVVVDDGSTDGSAEVVRSISDSRIRLVQQVNAGVSAARNRGIAEAKYDWIAFLDGDDLWKLDYLAKVVELISKFPEAEVIGVNYEMHTADGRVIPTLLNKMPFEQEGMLTNYFDVASCSNPPICSISVTVRKSAIQSIGGFPSGITNGEDLLTWARLASKYKIAYSMEPLAKYMLKADYGNNSKPRNIPQGNAVGEQLELLLNEVPSAMRESLRQYIGRWYKIRSNIFLRGGEKKNAWLNIWRAIKYQPDDFKLYIYLAFWFLPTSLINKIFKRLS